MRNSKKEIDDFNMRIERLSYLKDKQRSKNIDVYELYELNNLDLQISTLINAFEILTKEESILIDMKIKGYKSTEIGENLRLSASSVNTRYRNICKNLDKIINPSYIFYEKYK